MRVFADCTLIYVVFCRKNNNFEVVCFVEKTDADNLKKLKLHEYDEITIKEVDLYW